MKFIAYDIDWNYEIEEVSAQLDNLTYENAAARLGIPKDRYANMTTDERLDYALDVLRHNKTTVADFFNLPEEVEIPEELEITDINDDMSDVTDWLSDEYGFYINGYQVKEAKELDIEIE
jgi:hypothetical protein